MRPHLTVSHLLVFGTTVLALLIALNSRGDELPPEIQVDRLLVQAEREIEDGEHWSAVFTFERILAVCEEHGLAIPTEFWFRQAGVLYSAGLHERAVDASTRYLKEVGRDGEHYQAALEILDAAEVGLAEARREEARAKAAAERAQRERAARAKAIVASIPDMVTIPAGTFRMGCVTGRNCNKWEMPVREVRIGEFMLSTYEVKFTQWDICTKLGPCRWASDEGWGRDNRPVVNVTWDDAQTYVAWLQEETGNAYRLPSEAEWEYAARAGTETRYISGNRINRGETNWNGEQTRPVGSYPANPFSLYDMTGNVSEWVQDCWHDNYRGGPTDGEAWQMASCSTRVYRGGSWAGRTSEALRLAARWGRYPHRSYSYVGFRIARSLDP